MENMIKNLIRFVVTLSIYRCIIHNARSIIFKIPLATFPQINRENAISFMDPGDPREREEDA